MAGEAIPPAAEVDASTLKKVEAFIELMRPYGILELARTGRIAMVRGAAKPAVAAEGI